LEICQNNPDTEIQGILASDQEDTLLHCAARSGYLDTVVELVNFGVDVNVLNNNRETPLLQASRAGHFEVCEFLMRNGATAGLASVWGETPMHFLIFDNEKIDSIADMMVGKKANTHAWVPINPRAQDDGFTCGTPLHYATVRNHIQAIKALLRLGADPFYTSAKLEIPSAICLAVGLNYARAVELMADSSSRPLNSDD
jgi:ankyrin repeat protein